MDTQQLREQLERHEGLRLKPYKDTVGKLTIGIGRNLDDKGISREEAFTLLDNDIAEVVRQLEQVDEYQALDEIRQTVLANLCFNVGFKGIIGFKRMWRALAKRDYAAAAAEMLDSKWAKQVGRRATELAEIMRTGEVER
jgi:lysozyme